MGARSCHRQHCRLTPHRREDHDPAEASLAQLGNLASYMGYVETSASEERALDTETGKIFDAVSAAGAAASSYALTSDESVWEAIRGFFQRQAEDTTT